MAEGIISNVAGELITKLGSRHIRTIGLWGGVKAELKKLENTVSMIQAVVLDAEEQYSKSNQVKIWVESLKEALYDAEDLLDEFSAHALRQQVMKGCGIAKEVRLFFSSSNQFAYGLKMAFEIKAIRDRLKGIHENRSMFYLEEGCLKKHLKSEEREQTHSSAPKVVVGRENDKNEIIKILLSNYEENVSIVSIVGIGGLGKTTLAQFVYSDEIIETHFELKLWVSVSDHFDVRLIVAKILESVTGERHLDLEMNTLKNLLHDKINGRKYLLVLDDMWNENWERWFHLKELLAGGARGSRILVTSRLKNVADMIQSDSIYELKGLNDVHSWSLFTDMAFKQGQVPSSSHEGIGKEIMAKCAGVPLAIRVIGRLLYFKNTISEWQSFKDEELINIDHEEDGILPNLKLSYDHLHSHLKRCFAYCSLFPKGYIINVESLIYLWMAQGYIKSSDSRRCLEDIGFEYFTDLLWRSFFQVQEVDVFGVTSCKMHDLMHDLAALVAGGESTLLNSKAECIDERVRHVFFVDELDSWGHVSSSLLNARKVRTFAAPICKSEEDHCHVIFSNLKRLRVLNLHNSGVETIPRSIAKLKHIRYLDLSHNKGIELLPDSITKLQTLQVLKLTKCERLRQLPKRIKKLVSLRLLNIGGCDGLTHMPRGLRKLTSLQNLSTFIVAKDNGISKHSGGLGELHDLENLRGRLEILNLLYVKNPASEFEAANLKDKQHLRSLLLSWKLGLDGDDDVDNGVNDDEISIEELQPHLNLKCLTVNGCGRVKFPSWVSSLTNLVILEIDNCKKCQCVPALDQFRSLQSLTFKNFSDLEYIESNDMSGSTLFFPSLEKLMLMNCPNLKGWWRESLVPELLQFHRLADLWIESCYSLASMPLIPSVERLEVRNASMKSLEDILKVKISVSQCPPLSRLTTLRIEKIEDLEFLPEELLQNLTSLRHLVIVDCLRITTLSNAIRHLTSLQVLNIEGCKEQLLDDENDSGTQWQWLRNLQHFVITNFQKLTRLPEGLQHVTTLQKLSIKSCPNLMSLPEWMGNLTALQVLEIDNCPQLSERCRNDVAGADRHKIAHIPSIRISD
ncbi:hypothetical protein P3X46_024134 [Hevea brasiliensis]|uniref:Uncharacterized protein n=1 Tax=Hevea brasiliensis TaxID=3981 RepID=A0ABQ9L1J6_HEVBR|nr:putative disease resistance protein RGA3 [Hevea brasiliensis]KAJ9158565.1 hypothetical protein P3X46_024134 [Hevea brasiliensis]